MFSILVLKESRPHVRIFVFLPRSLTALVIPDKKTFHIMVNQDRLEQWSFTCETEQEKTKWMEGIQKCIDSIPVEARKEAARVKALSGMAAKRGLLLKRTGSKADLGASVCFLSIEAPRSNQIDRLTILLRVVYLQM